MAAEWEYTVVQLPAVIEQVRERDYTEMLNRVAAHGWRLVAVAPAHSNTYAYFERRAATE